MPSKMCHFLFQMKPTRCTLFLSIFISTSVHVLGNYVPIIRRTLCIYATLVFFTLYGWLSGRDECHILEDVKLETVTLVTVKDRVL